MPPVDPFNASRLSLVITSPDGRTRRWGPDELDDGDVPSGLRFTTTDPGGDSDLSCELLRRPDLDQPESILDAVEVIGPGAEVVWEGRFAQFPVQQDQNYSVTPGAEGWVASLRDRPDALELYVDRDLSRWHAMSLTRRQTLQPTYAIFDPNVVLDANGPALETALTSSWTTQAEADAWYDSAGIPIGSVYYSWERSNVNNADGNYEWAVRLPTDGDTLTGDTTGTLIAPGPAQGTLTATTTSRVYAVAYVYYGATRSDTENHDYAIHWPCLAVYGTHGLTLVGTASASDAKGVSPADVIRHAVAKYAPGLTIGDIEADGMVIPHLAFTDPTTAEEIVKRANGYRLASWGVEPPGRRFFLRQPNPDRLTWKARVDEGATLKLDGPALQRAINGVVVTFTDPSGRSSTVGPPGSNCEHTDTSLQDLSESNIVNQHGGTKWDTLSLSDVNTLAGAISLGAIYLTEILSRPSRRGEIDLTGLVEHPTAGLRPVWAIRAGDFIDLTDTNANSLGGARRIIATSYEHDTRTITLTLDQTAFTLESLLAILGAELIR